MSLLDSLKDALKSLIGTKTDKVVEDSKVKVEEKKEEVQPIAEVTETPEEETVEVVENPADSAVGGEVSE